MCQRDLEDLFKRKKNTFLDISKMLAISLAGVLLGLWVRNASSLYFNTSFTAGPE